MNRIKNNPDDYLKRSDLGPKRREPPKGQHTPGDKKREKDYLIAPIDDAGYIDFKMLAITAC